MTFELTQEQKAIAAAVKDGVGAVVVDAAAGSGKTTTKHRIVNEYIPQSQRVLMLAYNKSAREEDQSRLTAPNAEVHTFNSLGYKVLRGIYGWSKISFDKYEKLADEYCKSLGMEGGAYRELHESIMETFQMWVANTTIETPTSLKPMIFLGNESPDPLAPGAMIFKPYAETRELIEEVAMQHGTFPTDETLHHHVWHGVKHLIEQGEKLLTAKKNKSCAFIDQVFWIIRNLSPENYGEWVSEGYIQRYDWVMVDEAQDTSPIDRALVSLFLKRNEKGEITGRPFIVGDGKQAIYAFRGADSAGFENTKVFFNAKSIFPLSTSWRSTKKAAARAKLWKPEFNVPDTAYEGTERAISIEEVNNCPDDWWLIFRTRGSMVGQALRWHLQGRKYQIIGESRIPIFLARPIWAVSERSNFGIYNLHAHLKEFEGERIAKMRQSGTNEYFVLEFKELMQALHQTLKSVAPDLGSYTNKDVKDLVRAVQKPFWSPRDGVGEGVKLFTGHSVKGLENDVIVNMTPDLFPMKWKGQTEAEMVQEMNLRYILETRNKRDYYVLQLPEEEEPEKAATSPNHLLPLVRKLREGTLV